MKLNMTARKQGLIIQGHNETKSQQQETGQPSYQDYNQIKNMYYLFFINEDFLK
ncbi:MAG: hypothetical protein JW997_00575 [Actinobacteria bacterium]|nr:hypothetical protein [Actinomycetota bacterium]